MHHIKSHLGTFTGTSVSAAHTAGVVAMMLEWGTVRGNDPGMDTSAIKNQLIGEPEEDRTLYILTGIGVMELWIYLMSSKI